MNQISTWRRIAVIVIVVSLALTALVGIVALFSGEFGEIQGKILLTTLIVAGFSVLALCNLTIVERRVRIVGFVGAALTVVTFVLGLTLIWAGWENDLSGVFRAFAAFGVVAVAFAQASLLLVVTERGTPALSVSVYVTLALVALVALMIVLPIVTDGRVPGEGGDTYWRFFGALAILDAVGTVTVPVVALVSRAGRRGVQAASEQPTSIQLPGNVAERLRSYAAAVAADPADVAAFAISEHLERNEPAIPPRRP
ncbi:hypothetical protein GCM10027416_14840 [Okibacterium endophyticum]